ncbi:MAG: hypothetical protein CMJ83_06820 [Planctomycetes bacterium]|nr:hypothetical protein [Planctomycetota bacterium]
MAFFSYARNGRVLLVRTVTERAAESSLILCAVGFMVFGLAVGAMGHPAYGVLTALLGVACLTILFLDVRLHVERAGNLRVKHVLFGRLPVAWSTFASGTWKLSVVAGRDDWNPEGPHPWQLVIRGDQGRQIAPYAFLRKEGALRLRQRILAFLQDSPF